MAALNLWNARAYCSAYKFKLNPLTRTGNDSFILSVSVTASRCSTQRVMPFFSFFNLSLRDIAVSRYASPEEGSGDEGDGEGAEGQSLRDLGHAE